LILHLSLNKIPPPVQIEQITADRKVYEASSKLRLPPLVRDLEIDYTALSLVAPEKNRFRYKLEGRDRDWQDAGNRRQAFYGDLAPRNYRFRVMASNNSGVWNQTGAVFDFSIAPAYYQTSWFQASCIAALLALIWGLYRYRLHQIARQFNARLEERVGERTRIARDLHDTLLQSFQGLMLRLQVVDNLMPDGRAREELELALERADQAIAEGRDAVHALRTSATTTNDLAQALTALGDELAGEDTAGFRLVVEGPAGDLHPIIRDEVYRIAREALRNAFSHARARQIEVEITYASQMFRLRIRDDGAGMAPAILEEGRPGHYGLPGMRERAKEIGAKLSIWSGIGAGTEIELSIDGSIAYGTSAYGKSADRSRLRFFGKAG
jgi:signal transduction histidine kinase